MKKLALSVLISLGFTSLCHGAFVSWHASSGLLPSDSSIPIEESFVLNGDQSWLTFTDGFLNVEDSSTIYQLNFKNHNTLPNAQSDWMYQIELRMNSHERPIRNTGGGTGFTINDRRIFLGIAKNQVGFGDDNAFVNGETYSLDTTNGFHLYKVTKESDMVKLYIDGSTLPVLSINYSDFPVLDSHNTSVDLIQTSNPGVTNLDIKSFTYNTDGTVGPAPDIGCFAVSVIDYYNPGSGPHTDPAEALGPPDVTSSGDPGLYSMGAYGWIELELGRPVVDVPGYDFGVWEEEKYSPYPVDWETVGPDEDADVYLSFDKVNWILVGQARRGVIGTLVYDISGSGMSGARFVRIEDVSGRTYPNAEGFDLDAITVFECLNIPDGLVAYYPFNGNAKDQSGNGHDGTVSGATLTEDRFGNPENAYMFDGVDDYINVAGSSDFALSSWTISGWIKINDNPGPYSSSIISKMSTTDHYNFGITFWPVQWEYRNALCTGYETCTDEFDHQIYFDQSPLHEWIFFASTRDDNSGRHALYVNGGLVGEGVWMDSPCLDTADLRIGHKFGANSVCLNGVIDDIRIYNRALSDAEIQGLFNNPAPDPCVDFGGDTDNDGTCNDVDNCPSVSNPNQLDADGDAVGDLCDNCPLTSNSDQLDFDEDTIGDVCDNCSLLYNSSQANADEDEFGDVCDNCPEISNADQADVDQDKVGDICDNCPHIPNPDQLDTDNDGIGNVCATLACDCDLNNDALCDDKDQAIFGDSYGWGQFDCNEPDVECPCDLNGDGTCDSTDGVSFTEAWAQPQCGYAICSCDLVPTNTQLQRGDTLSFDAYLSNITEKSGAVQFGTKVTKPNGTQTGFIWGPVDVGLAPYKTPSGFKSHVIPANYPFGTSIYQGYVAYPGMGIIAECEFEFEVVP